MKRDSVALVLCFVLLGVGLLLAGCSGSDKKESVPDSSVPDVAVDIAGDVQALDVSPDLPGPDLAVDANADAAVCADGDFVCSGNAVTLERCVGGMWLTTDCMREYGQLCEAGACVDPWRYGSPVFDPCTDNPRATPETLAEKADYYDEIAARLHINPDLKFITNLTLPSGEVPCAVGETAPCYGPVPSPEEATPLDVQQWHTGENDGLWSALYLASQGFRYGATRSPEALATIKILLEGEDIRMRITGVPGVFTRQYIPPSVPGIECPTDDASYTTDLEKDDNRWVKIKDDGCVWVVDRETLLWTKTEHCGLDEFKGWCWLDNVSQDEYAGHIFALGVLYKLVDDPDVQEKSARMLAEVAQHLMEHDLTFVDWDGRITEHGYLYPTSGRDTPGYLAMQSLDFVLAGAVAGNSPDVWSFYNDCLLQKSGSQKCLDWPLEQPRPFTFYFDKLFMYMPPNGCKSNWNNMSMLMAALHNLIWFERDSQIRRLVQEAMDEEVMRADNPRALIVELNSWFNFIWASQKFLGPKSDGPAYQAVKDGICSLREFPARKHAVAHDNVADYPYDCDGRLSNSLTNVPIAIEDRCLGTFIWWGDPYTRDQCIESTTTLFQPGDYLLAYWMGRYYGFVEEGM